MELKIEDLSLEEKIGQMIIVGIDGNKITERTRKLILKYKIGGIILYRNFYLQLLLYQIFSNQAQVRSSY